MNTAQAALDFQSRLCRLSAALSAGMPTSLSLEEIMYVMYQHDVLGARPDQADFDCGKRSAGAIRDLRRHALDESHKLCRRFQAYANAYGEWTPRERLCNYNSPPKGLDGSLNNEQQRAVDMVSRGCNVFLTGGAGTGKSFTLRELIKVLKLRWGEAGVAVTGTTGIAAQPHKGSTLHSYLGLYGHLRPEAPSAATVARLRATQALVIEEVSMLDADLLDYLDMIARQVCSWASPSL